MFAYGSYNIHADTGPLTTWLGFAFMILSIVGMVLRVYAKRCVGQGFFKEDWVLLVAFAFSLVLYAAAVCGKFEFGIISFIGATWKYGPSLMSLSGVTWEHGPSYGSH